MYLIHLLFSRFHGPIWSLLDRILALPRAPKVKNWYPETGVQIHLFSLGFMAPAERYGTTKQKICAERSFKTRQLLINRKLESQKIRGAPPPCPHPALHAPRDHPHAAREQPQRDLAGFFMMVFARLDGAGLDLDRLRRTVRGAAFAFPLPFALALAFAVTAVLAFFAGDFLAA